MSLISTRILFISDCLTDCRLAMPVVFFLGGMYGGASIIKSRLLPFLGQNFFTSGGSVTADTSLSVLAEAAAKNREIDDLQDMYETSLNELEADLKDKEAENQDLRDEYVPQ